MISLAFNKDLFVKQLKNVRRDNVHWGILFWRPNIGITVSLFLVKFYSFKFRLCWLAKLKKIYLVYKLVFLKISILKVRIITSWIPYFLYNWFFDKTVLVKLVLLKFIYVSIYDQTVGSIFCFYFLLIPNAALFSTLDAAVIQFYTWSTRHYRNSKSR